MATVRRAYIFATCFISGLAAIFTVVSLATEEWVTTDSAKWVDQAFTTLITVKYGLFQGYYSQKEPASLTIQITMTCLIKENVCALLCGKTSEDRYTLLRQLYNNDSDAEQVNSNCPTVQRAFVYTNRDISTFASEDSDDKTFINSGVWISTITFLVLSIVFGMVSSALALWNTVANPIETYFSVFGLYIYNAVALCCSIIVMFLWGIMHTLVTFHDIGIFYTLTGKINSDKTAFLGYSYWLNIVSIVGYIASISFYIFDNICCQRTPRTKWYKEKIMLIRGYIYINLQHV